VRTESLFKPFPIIVSGERVWDCGITSLETASFPFCTFPFYFLRRSNHLMKSIASAHLLLRRFDEDGRVRVLRRDTLEINSLCCSSVNIGTKPGGLLAAS
jgi:hypothetical protein